MKAVVIGGTSGLGRGISEERLARGYDVTTVSRSSTGLEGCLHFSCDVGARDQFVDCVKRIKSECKSIDVLACVAGFFKQPLCGRSNKDVERRQDIIVEVFDKNVNYVLYAIDGLSENLLRSSNPRVITIGSRWSYKSCPFPFILYSYAKHMLRYYINDMAKKFPQIKINNFCVPPMDTPTYWDVRNRIIERAAEYGAFFPGKEQLADPKIIASGVVDLALTTEKSGSAFGINPDGSFSGLVDSEWAFGKRECLEHVCEKGCCHYIM